MAAADQAMAETVEPALAHTVSTQVLRVFAWTLVSVLFVFLINNYLTFWRDWPGLTTIYGELGIFGAAAPKTPLTPELLMLGWVQLFTYVLAFIAPIAYVAVHKHRTLREDSKVMTDITAYIARAAFWAVLLVGLVDAFISFLRVEEFLNGIVGDELGSKLGRSQFRGPYVHLPLILVALVIAIFNKGLGFTWLTLLVVVAELQIVFSRFIFSYEQAYMGDLVRFWYGALFLFASAYTLVEEGHVRVDVLYANFSKKTRGLVNAVGSIFLGASLCWIILTLGMMGKSNIINSPILSLEVSQSGFGMYVKYLMAGFLAIFASTMLIQFASFMLSGVADYRGDPGEREIDNNIIH